jgi:hypothetical protein
VAEHVSSHAGRGRPGGGCPSGAREGVSGPRLHDRLAEVGRILASAPTTTRTAADVKKFTDYRRVIEAFIDSGGTTNSVAGLP